jgi:hypothetical protein
MTKHHAEVLQEYAAGHGYLFPADNLVMNMSSLPARVKGSGRLGGQMGCV